MNTEQQFRLFPQDWGRGSVGRHHSIHSTHKPGTAAYADNSCTWEVKAGGAVQAHPRLHKTLSLKREEENPQNALFRSNPWDPCEPEALLSS